jgi:hypothetical protein
MEKGAEPGFCPFSAKMKGGYMECHFGGLDEEICFFVMALEEDLFFLLLKSKLKEDVLKLKSN